MSRTIGGRRTIAIARAPAPPSTGSEATDRAIDELATALDDATSAKAYVADVDLIVGTNTINHNLGRKATLVHVTPASASTVFGWGWDPTQPGNPRPEVVTQVVAVGVPMTVRIEVH